MGKLIFIIAFIGLGIFLIVQFYNLGKTKSTPPKKYPVADDALEKRVKALKDEIERVQSEYPESIEKQKERTKELEKELERAERLKDFLNS